MRLRTFVPVLVLCCALPLMAGDNEQLLNRAAENAAKGGSAGTIQFGSEPPVDVLSFSWGVSNSGTIDSGSGGGAGKAQFSDFNFIKRLDKASPQLMRACARGEHFPDVTVSLKDTKGTTYMTIKFKTVLISSYQTGGSSGDVVPLDSISLNFAEMNFDGILIGLLKD